MTSDVKKEKPDWLVPDYPPLKYDDCVGKAAVEGQLVFYPKVVRSMVDPPLVGQSLSLLSFMFFKEPRKLSNGKLVYGYVKSRGNWADDLQAKREASKIVREVDSKFQIRLAPTGAWVPLTEEQAFIKEQIDVRMRKEEIHLRDEAVKEKEAEQRRIMREIREKEEELKKGDIYDDPTSLTYYSMRRVTNNALEESIERQQRQLETTKDVRIKVQKELKKLDMEHPEYDEMWIDRYNEERRKSGIPDYVPSEKQLEEYRNLKFEDLHIKKEEENSDDETEKIRKDYE